jgi:hypothetical protein
MYRTRTRAVSQGIKRGVSLLMCFLLQYTRLRIERSLHVLSCSSWEDLWHNIKFAPAGQGQNQHFRFEVWRGT